MRRSGRAEIASRNGLNSRCLFSRRREYFADMVLINKVIDER